MDKKVFLENLNNMYEGMLKVGPNSDYDTIKELLKENSNESKGD